MNKISIFSRATPVSRWLSVLFTLLIFAACKQESPSDYLGKNALYFDDINGKREVSQTFFLLPETQMSDTLFIRVNTMGQLAAHNRTVSIRQINTEDTLAAKPDIHYLSFKNPEIEKQLIIQANSSFANIPLVLLRHPDMEKSEFKIELGVFENEYFESIQANEYTRFTVITTAIAVKPARWDEIWMRYFGDWGSVKMKFIMKVTGYKDWDKSVNDVQFKTYLAGKCKATLHEYNTAHPDKPLSEADGTVVLFP